MVDPLPPPQPTTAAGCSPAAWPAQPVRQGGMVSQGLAPQEALSRRRQQQAAATRVIIRPVAAVPVAACTGSSRGSGGLPLDLSPAGSLLQSPTALAALASSAARSPSISDQQQHLPIEAGLVFQPELPSAARLCCRYWPSRHQLRQCPASCPPPSRPGQALHQAIDSSQMHIAAGTQSAATTAAQLGACGAAAATSEAGGTGGLAPLEAASPATTVPVSPSLSGIGGGGHLQ